MRHGEKECARNRHRAGICGPRRLSATHPELIGSYIASQIEQLRALGFDVVSCLIDLGETAEAVAATALRTKRFDCVVIGAGLRQPVPQLLLFEKIINLVHALAPGAKICFNTNPADTAAAVQRWIRP
jgi:hypothetical protein